MTTFLLLFYLTAILLALKTRSPLHVLVFIATTFQFSPLFLTLLGNQAIFWPQSRYIIAHDSSVYIALQLILVSSLAGFSLSSLTSLSNIKFRHNYQKNNCLTNASPKISPILVTGFLIFGAILILINSLSGKESIFTGYHLTISLIIATGFVFYLIKKSKLILAITLNLLIIYVIQQFLGGDRDYVTIILALTLYLLTFSTPSKKKLLSISLLLFITFLFSVFVSVYRQDMDVSIGALLNRVYFNSWSGIIKPLILMLLDEGIPSNLLLGKTYFYAIVSAPPSFIFELLGATKPFNAHNPAWWYPEANGGMHILGVALKNGSLVGVFLQSFVLGVGSTFLEKVAKHKNNFFYHLLFVAVATATLKTLWYSPINLINAFVFWGIFCLIIVGAQRFISVCLRKN